MEVRIRKKDGTKFWGCLRYPTCKRTKKYEGEYRRVVVERENHHPERGNSSGHGYGGRPRQVSNEGQQEGNKDNLGNSKGRGEINNIYQHVHSNSHSKESSYGKEYPPSGKGPAQQQSMRSLADVPFLRHAL